MLLTFGKLSFLFTRLLYFLTFFPSKYHSALSIALWPRWSLDFLFPFPFALTTYSSLFIRFAFFSLFLFISLVCFLLKCTVPLPLEPPLPKLRWWKLQAKGILCACLGFYFFFFDLAVRVDTVLKRGWLLIKFKRFLKQLKHRFKPAFYVLCFSFSLFFQAKAYLKWRWFLLYCLVF